jgi:SAM-dependent methyltransferase
LLKETLWSRKIHAILDLLASVDLENRTILDIGCNNGYISKALKMSGLTVIGLEINPEAAKRAKINGINVVIGDAENLPFIRVFDYCLLSEVAEHLIHPGKALREASRVLEENGRFIVIIPNDRNFKIMWMLLFRIKEASMDRGHLHAFTPEKLVDITRNHSTFINEKGIPFDLPFSVCLNYAVCFAKKGT